MNTVLESSNCQTPLDQPRFSRACGPVPKDSPVEPASCLKRAALSLGVVLVLCARVSWESLAAGGGGAGDDYRTVTNILYRAAADLDAYSGARCRLDVYHPVHTNGFAAVVWFHGGGLTSGQRFIPEPLKRRGIAVVAAGYRLSPDVGAPVWIEDAAAAVAWTFQHIAAYGGATNRIFVSGHSAGGYLAAMVGLDKRWLAVHGLDADLIAGLAPFSGHGITHFMVRKERGISDTQPVIDDLAPLYHVRKDAPPLWLITGDRELEMLGRYEENAYLWRMMKETGHTRTRLFELDGFNHGQMAEPAFPLLLRLVAGEGK